VNDHYAPNVFGDTPDRVTLHGDGWVTRHFYHAGWIDSLYREMGMTTHLEPGNVWWKIADQ
jgi:hypothetical protein